jgi:methylated-DNA-protein-cysteine methyltransferase-like protein
VSTPLRQKIYAVVRRIPSGKVATYGQIAALVGKPRASRAVGMALGALSGELVDTVPWQRVISASGRCSHRDGFWAGVQRDLLEQEGVRFDRSGRVDSPDAFWTPRPRPLLCGKLGKWGAPTSKIPLTHR